MNRLFLYFIFLFLVSTSAGAGELILIKRGTAQITELRVDSAPELKQEKTKAQVEQFALVSGVFKREGWALIRGKAKIRIRPDGGFSLKVNLQGVENAFTLVAVGPAGEIQTQAFTLSYLAYSEKPVFARRHKWTASAGVSSFSYTQDAGAGFSGFKLSEMAISLEGLYEYQLVPDRWSLGVSVFGTAFALSSTPSNDSARWLGVDIKAGYRVPQVKGAWRLFALAGAYYTTMSVAQGDFGFQNIKGPELMALLSRVLSPKGQLYFSLKFAPTLLNGIVPPSLSGMEVRTRATYERRLSQGHLLPIYLDYSHLSGKLTSQDGVTQIPLTLSAITLGVGYSL